MKNWLAICKPSCGRLWVQDRIENPVGEMVTVLRIDQREPEGWVTYIFDWKTDQLIYQSKPVPYKDAT